MKRSIIIISTLLILTLLLTACAAGKLPASDGATEAAQTDGKAVVTDAETEATKPETEPTPVEPDPTEPEAELRENSAFTHRFSDCSETVIGFLYNEPFSEGDPIPTEVWNEGEFDKLVLVPRYVGSTVSAYQISYDEDGLMQLAEEPAYSSVISDGDEIGASLYRPEGAASWYVSITLPDGRSAGMALAYNGRYGTPLYEFIEDPYLSKLIEEPTAMEDWAPQMELIGSERFWAFWRAAMRSGMDPWDACERFHSLLTEVGDGAAFTRVSGGNMDGDTFRFQTARFHMAYFAEGDSLQEETSYQYERYQSVGNADGILGPDAEANGEELFFTLTGLTIFNPGLSAKQVQITVNGIDCGSFDLSPNDFCTLIPLELPDFKADQPISVEVKVLSVNYGTTDTAIIDVYPGLSSNISNAV